MKHVALLIVTSEEYNVAITICKNRLENPRVCKIMCPEALNFDLEAFSY
jgi:hypothetical protein